LKKRVDVLVISIKEINRLVVFKQERNEENAKMEGRARK